MTYSREQVLELIRAAFNEGFLEGSKIHRNYDGGKTWQESRAFKKFESIASQQGNAP